MRQTTPPHKVAAGWALEAGRVVTVTVEDEAGYPVEDLPVSGPSGVATRDGSGKYLLRDLPSGVVEITLRLDGFKRTFQHDTAFGSRPAYDAELGAR